MKKTGEETLEKVKKDDEKQSRRFVETAIQQQAELKGEKFEKAVDSLKKKPGST